MKLEVSKVYGRLAGEIINPHKGAWEEYAWDWHLVASASADDEGSVDTGQQRCCTELAAQSERVDRRNLRFEMRVDLLPKRVRLTADGVDLAPVIDVGLHFIEHGLICGHYSPSSTPLNDMLRDLFKDNPGGFSLFDGGPLGFDVTVIEIPLTPRPDGSAGD